MPGMDDLNDKFTKLGVRPSQSPQRRTQTRRPDRKTFYLHDDPNKPVLAAGVLFHTDEAILLIESRGGYEDIGGKVDHEDADLHQTVNREVEEETNGIIKNIVDRLDDTQCVYVPRSKYVIYLVQATADESRLKGPEFGDRELKDDIARTIAWMPIPEFVAARNKMNWRLRSSTVFRKVAPLTTAGCATASSSGKH